MSCENCGSTLNVGRNLGSAECGHCLWDGFQREMQARGPLSIAPYGWAQGAGRRFPNGCHLHRFNREICRCLI